VPKEKPSKWDNKAMKCILIGYGVGVKGYKLYDLVVGKVLYGRSVIFKEVKCSPTMV
jgi:hypothetical protein